MKLTMNKKERLIKIINNKEVDRSPVICPGGMMNPIVKELLEKENIHFPEAHFDGAEMAKLSKAIVEGELFENYGVPFCMTVEAEAMGAEVDMGSDLYEPHVKKYPIMDIDDLSVLKKINFNEGRVKAVLDALKILQNEDIPTIGNIPGPFSLACSLIEPSKLYTSLRKNKKSAHNLLSIASSELSRFAREELRVGADVICISDPSGTAEILGPQYFEEYMLYYLNFIIENIKREKDVPVIVHICGKMNSAFHLIDNINADVLSFDALVSLKEAKKYTDKVIMGNISTYLIEKSNPETVRNTAASKNGNKKDIVAPACGLGLNSPLVNIRAVLEGVKSAEDKSQ